MNPNPCMVGGVDGFISFLRMENPRALDYAVA
jgi:hypothetical protein